MKKDNFQKEFHGTIANDFGQDTLTEAIVLRRFELHSLNIVHFVIEGSPSDVENSNPISL